jgi:hypothetical protein
VGTPGVDADRSILGLGRALYQEDSTIGDAGEACGFSPYNKDEQASCALLGCKYPTDAKPQIICLVGSEPDSPAMPFKERVGQNKNDFLPSPHERYYWASYAAVANRQPVPSQGLNFGRVIYLCGKGDQV